MAGPPTLSVDTTRANGNGLPEPPRLAAVFLVKFDVRKGYTIAWQRSNEGVQLDGVVDYKSLPSGLHNVEEDLVYFVHDEHAGVSAYLNKPGSESERNARMLAVGVLVPLEHGKVGKAWRCAEQLKELAAQQISDLESFDALEKYWNDNRISGEHASRKSPVDSPVDSRIEKDAKGGSDGYRPSRGFTSTTSLPTSSQSLSPHHPALSLPALVRLFGPLLFPLYRAALLRKRILFVGDAPVEQACNFVYDLSILSSIPKSLLDLLPIDSIPDVRLHPLFSVGVQDIPLLANSRALSDPYLNVRQGWIACTTDDVLATKPELFDILVHLPSAASSRSAEKKIYPGIVPSSPELSRAFPKIGLRSTQRDARRYLNLRSGLRSLGASQPDSEVIVEVASSSDDARSMRSVTSAASSTLSRTSIVEPNSWPLIAYTSLIWWASAGEKKMGPNEEEDVDDEQDADLLGADVNEEEGLSREVAIVGYFHRLTQVIFGVISDAIAMTDGDAFGKADYQDDDPLQDGQGDEQSGAHAGAESAENALSQTRGEEERLLPDEDEQVVDDDDVEITAEQMRMMGLDVWNTKDREFVKELVEVWWGRQAVVRGGRVECCGVRIL